MDSDQFIRAMSRINNFTLKDNRVFLASFIQAFAECVETRTPLMISGLGTLEFRVIPEREGNNLADVRARLKDPNHKIERVVHPETVRAFFRIGNILRDSIRENNFVDDDYEDGDEI